MKQNRRTKNISTAPNDECCSSGVEGLDNILDGGLPRDCFYLIQADPGSGKTTLALRSAIWHAAGPLEVDRVFLVPTCAA